jgi:tellurite resistance protein TehA-like permease
VTPSRTTNSTAAAGPIATLFPGYFALVMATGIISIAAHQQDHHWLADALYAVAAVGYIVLWVLLALRIVRFPRLFLADATDHAKGFAFLTTVAGTNVLGSASGIVMDWWDLAWILWWFSLPVYAILLYITLIAVVIDSDKPGLAAGINGTWFLIIVSTQSVAVLGALLLSRHPNDLLAFIVVAMFTLGLVIYVIVMTMVFLRWTFDPLDPTEASPPAWIAAGAVAISVLAGSNILLAADVSPRIQRLGPFLEGMTVLAWATATFWFPLMVAIGVWRHLVRRLPVRYHPSYWALVFPIGMYGAATFRMRAAISLDQLEWLPQITLVAAMAAWSATFIGLVHTLTTGLLRLRR